MNGKCVRVGGGVDLKVECDGDVRGVYVTDVGLTAGAGLW